MKKIEEMTDEELAPYVAEAHRRLMACSVCGGQTKAFHVHICADNGGVTLPLDHPMVSQMRAQNA